MKLTKNQQKFIKETYSNSDVCQAWKTNIKEAFPKLFKEEEFEVGDWIILTRTWLQSNTPKGLVSRIEKVTDRYNVFKDLEGNDFSANKDGGLIKKATSTEVEEHLIKEAKKRGFEVGVKLNQNLDSFSRKSILIDYDRFSYNFNCDLLYLDGWTIYEKGKWAEIIKTRQVTQEEVNEKFGEEVEIIN